MKILFAFFSAIYFSSSLIAQPLTFTIFSDSVISAVEYPAFTIEVANNTREAIYIIGNYEKYDIEYHIIGHGTKRNRGSDMLLDTSNRIYSNRIESGCRYKFGIIDRFFSFATRKCDFDYTGKIRCDFSLNYFAGGKWEVLTKTVCFTIREPSDAEMRLCEKLQSVSRDVDALSIAEKIGDVYGDNRTLLNRSFSDFVTVRVKNHRSLRKEGRLEYDKRWYQFAKLFGSEVYLLTVKEAIAHFNFKYGKAAKSFDITTDHLQDK